MAAPRAKPTTTAGTVLEEAKISMGDGYRFTEGVQLRRDLLELSESLGDCVTFQPVSRQPIGSISVHCRALGSFEDRRR